MKASCSFRTLEVCVPVRFVFVLTVLTAAAAFAAPPSTTPFLLQRGAIVDSVRGNAYIAAPGRFVDAIDLATGHSVWSSSEAALPIGSNGTFVVGQLEESAPAILQLAVLDAVTGRKVSSAAVTLPPDVRAIVSDGFLKRFRATAEPEGALFLVSWSYEDTAADPDDSPVRMFAGSFRLSPQDGRVIAPLGGAVSQLPPGLAAYGALSPEPWQAGGISARVSGSSEAPFVLKRNEAASGRALPDVVVSERGIMAVPSRDQRHFAVVERDAGIGPEWPEYRLRVFTTDTAEAVTEVRREIPATTFFIVGDTIALISPARTSYRGGVRVEPLSLSAVRLTTGVEKWRVELRDLRFRGPMPAARHEAEAQATSRGPLRTIVASLPTTGDAWTAQGPSPIRNGQVEGIPDGPVAGAVNSIVTHPTNANIVWIGTVNGGIWSTTNALSSFPIWFPRTDSLSTLTLAYLTVDTTDSSGNTLVAAAGATSSFSTSLAFAANGPLGGIIRTTDGGGSWAVSNALAAITKPTERNISAVVARGSNIVVSTWGDVTPWNNQRPFACGGKLYHSGDTGATFSTVSDVAGTVFDVKGVPSVLSQTGVMYAVSRDCAGTGSAIYKTTDGGVTWNPLPLTVHGTTIGDKLASSYVDNAKLAISWRPGDASHPLGMAAIAIGIVKNGQLDSVFESLDDGSTWTQLPTPPNMHPNAQGRLNFSIAWDTLSNDLVYVGGESQPPSSATQPPSYPNDVGAMDASGRLFRLKPLQATSITHCSTCSPASTLNNSAPHADSRFIAIDTNNNMLEADDGGIYRRTNPSGQGDWYSVNGLLQVTEAHDVAWDHMSHRIISGNQDTGVTEQPSTGSLTWDTVIQYGIAGAGDGGDVGVNETSSTTIAARWSSHQLFQNPTRRLISQNGGLLLTSAPSLVPTSGSANMVFTAAQFVTAVELNRIDGTHMLIGASNNIYESKNEGENITELTSTGAATSMIYGSTDSLDSFYAITKNGTGVHLYVRKSGTDPVTQVTGPWPAGTKTKLRDVTSDPSNSRRAYVVVQVDPYVASDSSTWNLPLDQKVYGTTDAGASWTDVTGDPNAGTTSDGGPLTTNDVPDIRTIVFVPGNPSRIVVGGLYGVFQMAIDTPGVWKRLGSGLPNAVINDLDYDVDDDTLVAGTMGRGVWKLTSVGGAMTSPPTAPTGVRADATTSSNVHVQWTQSSGATSYKIYRNSGSGYSVAGTANNTASSFDDSGVTAGNAYLYRVTAVNAGGESAVSNFDLATTVLFTTTVATGATISSTDFTELLTAVNAVRRLADPAGTTYPGISFTAPAPASGVPVFAAHLMNLRNGLDPARSALNLGAITYDDPTVTSGTTIIKASHVTQLRGGVQ